MKTLPQTERPLNGLVVLDFSQFLSGPLCTLKRADLGARVMKVERSGAGLEVDLLDRDGRVVAPLEHGAHELHRLGLGEGALALLEGVHLEHGAERITGGVEGTTLDARRVAVEPQDHLLYAHLRYSFCLIAFLTQQSPDKFFIKFR